MEEDFVDVLVGDCWTRKSSRQKELDRGRGFSSFVSTSSSLSHSIASSSHFVILSNFRNRVPVFGFSSRVLKTLRNEDALEDLVAVVEVDRIAWSETAVDGLHTGMHSLRGFLLPLLRLFSLFRELSGLAASQTGGLLLPKKLQNIFLFLLDHALQRRVFPEDVSLVFAFHLVKGLGLGLEGLRDVEEDRASLFGIYSQRVVLHLHAPDVVAVL